MLKRFINYYKRKKKMVDIFKCYSEYFHYGEYSFDKTMTYIYLKEDKNADKVFKMFKEQFLIMSYKENFIKTLIQFLIKLRFKNSLRVEKGKKELQGTVMLLGGAEKDYKIFDLNNKRIALIYTDKKEYETKIDNYKYFSNYFLIPNIFRKNDKDLVIIEKYIDFIQREEWTSYDYEMIVKNIFLKNNEYFENHNIENEHCFLSARDLLSKMPKDSLICEFGNNHILPEMLDKQFPYLKLHGDLWTSNILLSNNRKIYYIDWERSQNYLFFYDILHFIWADILQMVLKNNTKSEKGIYLKEYLAGKYDTEMEKIFKNFSLEYIAEYRKDYLNISFLNYIVDRYEFKEEESYRPILKEYMYLLNKIEYERLYNEVGQLK